MYELLIEAHRQRVSGQTDFFEGPNLSEIRHFLSLLLLKRGINELQKKRRRFRGVINIALALKMGRFGRKINAGAFYQILPVIKAPRANQIEFNK